MAQELGCNQTALGRRYDDVIETILMGMLWSGQTQTMMPKLHSKNLPGMALIRSMYLIREDDVIAWRDANNCTSSGAPAALRIPAPPRRHKLGTSSGSFWR